MIVLPMAGLSQRFFKAGYTVPKYMLDLHGRTVFAHAAGSFSDLFGQEDFLFICRQIYGTPDFIQSECRKMGLPKNRYRIVALDEETAGQAETVAAGLSAADVAAAEPLTIFNIDTIREGFHHPETIDVSQVDGYVEVFPGEGTHWSFVRPDDTDPGACRAAEVTEKVRISNLCSTGLYHFRTAGLFRDLYAEIATRNPADLQGGERYIAPLYNIAIQSGLDIRYSLISPGEVRFCGTPDEYLALKAEPF